MEFGVCGDKSKAFIRLDPRSKLLLLMAISIIMIGGTTVGIEGVLRIICAAIPFCASYKNAHNIKCFDN